MVNVMLVLDAVWIVCTQIANRNQTWRFLYVARLLKAQKWVRLIKQLYVYKYMYITLFWLLKLTFFFFKVKQNVQITRLELAL